MAEMDEEKEGEECLRGLLEDTMLLLRKEGNLTPLLDSRMDTQLYQEDGASDFAIGIAKKPLFAILHAMVQLFFDGTSVFKFFYKCLMVFCYNCLHNEYVHVSFKFDFYFF